MPPTPRNQKNEKYLRKCNSESKLFMFEDFKPNGLQIRVRRYKNHGSRTLFQGLPLARQPERSEAGRWEGGMPGVGCYGALGDLRLRFLTILATQLKICRKMLLTVLA